MNQTLLKVKNLEKFVRKHGDDSYIAQTISKMTAFKIKNYKKKIQRLEKELKKYEKTYKKKSSVFIKEFKSGKLGDDMDLIEWSSLYQMYSRLLHKKRELEDIER